MIVAQPVQARPSTSRWSRAHAPRLEQFRRDCPNGETNEEPAMAAVQKDQTDRGPASVGVLAAASQLKRPPRSRARYLHERQSRLRGGSCCFRACWRPDPCERRGQVARGPQGGAASPGRTASRRRARRRGSSRSNPRARPGFRRVSVLIRPTFAGSSRSCKRHPGRSTFAPCLEEPRWRARVRSRAAQTRHPGALAARMPGGWGQTRPRWAHRRSWLVARVRLS